MIDILGGVSGGLGLFFVGMWLLTENLKTLASRRIRMLTARWTGNAWMAMSWGALLGGITQNSSALTFVVVGMAQSGLLSVRKALPVILGGSFGSTLLVLIVTFDIELIALYVLGIASAVVVIERVSRYRPIAAALFGMGMIVFGLVLLKDSASPLAEQPLFGEIMLWSRDSLVVSFLGAAVLAFIVQSSNVVTIFGITMASIGFLTFDQAIMFTYGSWLGVVLVQYTLSGNLTGSSRQLSMYMVLYSVIQSVTMALLLHVELYLGVPLMKALVTSVDLSPSQQLVLISVIVDPLWMPVTISTLGPCARLLDRLWPRTELEDRSSTKFIHDHVFADVETSLVLVDMEQRRVLGMLSEYFAAMREESPLSLSRQATRTVLARIREFLEDLETRHPSQDAEDINSTLTRHNLLSWLEERVTDLCDELQRARDYPPLGTLRTSIVEGVDAVFLVMLHALETGGEGFRDTEELWIDDRSEVMRRIRDFYLDSTSPLGDAERATIYKLLSTTEQVFYLLSKLAQEFRVSPNIPGDPPVVPPMPVR